MAGVKPPEIAQFYDRLGARGMNLQMLAAAVGRDHSTVSRVLNGSRRRGPLWKKLERILMPDEIRLLDVAQKSTWNTHRLAKRPQWTAEKAEALAS